MSINISPRNVIGQCNLKCAYNFNYDNEMTNMVATNNQSRIDITYQTTNVPVTYNAEKYNVQSITIYSPSYHIYNGSTVDAEIVIRHMSPTLPNALLVFIPCVSSNNTNDWIHAIITGCQNFTKGTSTTISTNLGLDSIVPKTPFYSYTTSNNDSCIVFDKLQALNISTANISNLQHMINTPNMNVQGGDLYKNTVGPNTTSVSNDGIYISCNPTGASEEQVKTVVNTGNQGGFDLLSLFTNNTAYEVFSVIIKCVVVLLTFAAIWYSYKYIQRRFDIADELSETKPYISNK